MKLTTRSALALCAFTGLTAAAFAHPTISETLGVDVWNVSALHDQFEREKRITRTLEGRSEETGRRCNARMDLVQQVIDGQIPFLEGVRLNLELSQSCPEALSFMRSGFAGTTDLDKACAQLLTQIRATNDEHTDKLSHQFECEWLSTRR